MGPGELLASTATTIAQAARDESSDVWVLLLAALLGALVGGLLALIGSVLVKRWELRKATRIRMYDELLPAPLELYRRRVMMMRFMSQSQSWSPTPPSMELREGARELHRAGVIVGGRGSDNRADLETTECVPSSRWARELAYDGSLMSPRLLPWYTKSWRL